jgi:hypothetical protein
MTIFSSRKRTAESLVGCYVRFAHLPSNCNPTPIRVTEATPSGMIVLAGWAGYFAPHLFIEVPPPLGRKRKVA